MNDSSALDRYATFITFLGLPTFKLLRFEIKTFSCHCNIHLKISIPVVILTNTLDISTLSLNVI